MFETVVGATCVIMWSWLFACLSRAAMQRRELRRDAYEAARGWEGSYLEMLAYYKVSLFKHTLYLATFRDPMRLYRVA